MKNIGKAIMWFIAGFMAISALVFFPSAASILMVLFVALAVPVSSVQEFWDNHGVKTWIKTILLLVLFIASVASVPTSSDDSEKKTNAKKEQTETVSKKDEEKPKKEKPETKKEKPDTEAPKEEEPEYTAPEIKSIDTSDYLNISPDVLFEYGNYMDGKKVVTVVKVYQSGTDIKVKTENNDGYFYSIVCEFEDTEIAKSLKEDDVLTIAGIIKGKDPLADTISFLETPTVTLQNCSIVGLGEIKQEIEAEKDAQTAIGKEAKAAFEATIAESKKEERDTYISQCETVKYSDVERNPDNYDGRKVKISGKVIQVSEGWFDSVTLRVDCNGNIWYVRYSREEGESRILEGDWITGYGECDGVTSYTTVLGAKVTIPSMRMEYYD